MSNLQQIFNLLSTKDIADMAGVGMSAVSNWKKRHEDFPSPIWKDRLYDFDEVVHYLERRGDGRYQGS